jgi:shikimate kinase/3-dehydroquinate synthase
MRERGIVVYLDVPPQVLYERTRHDRNRPLLQVDNPRRRIEELYRQRDHCIARRLTSSSRAGAATPATWCARSTRRSPGTRQTYANPERGARRARLSDPYRPGSARPCGLILPHLKTRRVALVTNEVVGPLYLERLRSRSRGGGVRTSAVVLPDGEAHKDWLTLNLIFDMLLGERCERKRPP